MKALIRIGIITLFSAFLLPQEVTACDPTPAITISSPMNLGSGNFEIDIEVCIGDGGSLDGFTTTFPTSLNIVSFTPNTLSNGVKVAVGTNTTNVLDYNYALGTSSNTFVGFYSNICFDYSVTLDADPAGETISFEGVNCQSVDCPTSCAFTGGDVQSTVVPQGPASLTCGDAFTDGSTNYPNNSNDTYFICSNNGGPVTINFTAFELEGNYDFLNIYDSNTVGTGAIAGSPFTGTTSPDTITSTNGTGCFVAVFTSDGSVSKIGWEATVACCTTASFSEVVDCSSGTGTSNVTITGGTAPYTLVNTGDGTLSTTSVAADGGTVDITGLVNNDNYSFDLTDANSCTELFSGTFVDVTPPTAICQNIMVSLDPVTYSVMITPAEIDNGSSDNCSVYLALSNDTFGCSDIGDNTVTLTVTDPSGNSDTCDATVTVEGFPVGFAR